MIARGWSPSDRQRYWFLLTVGLALVANPLVLAALDVGEERYEYESVGITVSDGEVVYDGYVPRYRGVRGVDCYLNREHGQECLFEAWLAGNGSVSVRESGLLRDEPYVYANGSFYRRTHTKTEVDGDPRRGDVYTISLERVPASTVLTDVSVPEERVSTVMRRSVETGSATSTQQPVEEAVFVDTGSSYALVGPTKTRDPPDRTVPSALGVVIGLLLVDRARRPPR